MFKLFMTVKKVVHYTKLFSLIADTCKYFHDEGVKRGLFTEENPKSIKEIKE